MNEPHDQPHRRTVDEPHEPGRRGHLAIVDAGSGRAGSPTPSERMEVYLAMLRRGALPRGWPAARAKEWGLSKATVNEEIARARATLEASRAAPVAKGIAHELIVGAIELNTAARELLAAPLAAKGDDPEMVTAKAKALAERVKALTMVAGVNLKCAAELRQLHGLKPPETRSEEGEGGKEEAWVRSLLASAQKGDAIARGLVAAHGAGALARFSERAKGTVPPWKKQPTG